MRKRSALAIGILIGTLILSTAVPAHAAQRLRLYRGETSQGERIAFRVIRNDDGRFVQEIDVSVTFSCEDGTTQDWGFGWHFGGTGIVPITDGAFSYDDVSSSDATHIAGSLGSMRGNGTVSIAIPALTVDEQAMLCTTGDLAWDVEFIRVITRPRLPAPAGFVARAA